MAHPYGDLLRQYCARKRGLSQTRLAHLAGYDQAVLARMGQGGKDLTGPSGRERVVRVIEVLRDEGVLTTLDEANALLKAAAMPPLFDGQAAEAALIASLRGGAPPATFATPTPAATRPLTNLPAALSSFVGREREIAEVVRRLGTTRLLTLIGSGGCGKTRLALEVGAALVGPMHRLQALDHHDLAGGALPPQPTFADGVWLVELASLSDATLVAATVATALRLPPSNRPTIELLSEYLRLKHLLLILDNCEHLVCACAELSEALLRACPHLYVLATSREGLHIAGETIWRVPSLTTDEAVLLFEQRARSASPGFAVTAQNRATVAGICARLDGIPLALELAAARLPALSVEQIDVRLGDRFRLLTGGSRTALPRHQTLRAMIDWSYDLLTEDERALLRHLSVFAGGWTLEAAEALWGRPVALDLITQLVNKSLVVMDERGASPLGQPRYFLLETIRQYAHDRLVDAGELEEALTSLIKYLASQAGEVVKHVGSDEEKYWLDVLEGELDNLRVALGWLDKAGDPPTTKLLLAPMMVFWLQRGYVQEGIAWATTLMAKLGTLDQVDLLRWMAYLALRRGDLEQSLHYSTQAHSLALHLEDEDQILETTLDLAEYPQDYEHGKVNLERAILLARQTRKKRHVSSLLFHYGWLLLEHGEYDQAATTLNELLALGPDEGALEIEGKSPALTLLGILAYTRGEHLQARAVLEQSLMIARKGNNRVLVADALVELANVMLFQSDYAPVPGILKEALGIFHWVGNPERVVQCLAVAARLAYVQGQTARAVRLLASTADAYAHKRTVVCEHTMFYRDYERQLTTMRAEVDPAVFERAWAEGQAMTLDQAVEYALEADGTDGPPAHTAGPAQPC